MQARIKNAIGWSADHCTGFGFGSNATSYALGTILSTAQRPIQLSHAGSKLLDEINAFDAAEVATAHLGQINMIQVSSFCGPHGFILGADVLKPPNEAVPLSLKSATGGMVFSLDQCLAATEALLGTLDDPHFTIVPGSHVPCAGKSITREGPCEVYAGLALGVSTKNGTALLMEDVGTVSTDTDQLIENLVHSVHEVAHNQKTEFDVIYVGVKSEKVMPGMMGCALVAAPYLTLPQWSDEAIKDFAELDLAAWVKKHV